MRLRLVLVLAVGGLSAFALSACGSHGGATSAGAASTSPTTSAPIPAGFSAYSELGVSFAAKAGFSPSGDNSQADTSKLVTLTAPGGAAGFDPQIGIASQAHQAQDAVAATNLSLQVTTYTDQKVVSNVPVTVPGGGEGRLLTLTYVVKDSTGTDHPTTLEALRFRTAAGTGYEVFVRSLTADFARFGLDQVLKTVAVGTQTPS